MNMRAANLLGLVIIGILALSAGEGCGQQASLLGHGLQQGPPVAGKKLIKWGHDIPDTDQVRRQIKRMEGIG